MICPHCTKYIDFVWSNGFPLQDVDGNLITLVGGNCPSCRGSVALQIEGQVSTNRLGTEHKYKLLYPRKPAGRTLPPEVPDDYSQDYYEACLVLNDSSKASAALSRRLFQRLLHDHLTIKKGSLADEIQALLDSNQLPSRIAEAVDAIRNYGNFAAHPIKSQNTGQIIDVEPGEAEWTIEVLESLFDLYFVQPARLHQKRQALNATLQEAGKPPAK